jgi:hypothetical protein
MKRGILVLTLIASLFVGMTLGFAQLGVTHDIWSLVL